MALKLHIPAIKDKPLILADTDPLRISQDLTGLQSLSALDMASHLFVELEILNRQKISSSHRIQALDAYRPVIISTIQTLAHDYSQSGLPLHDKAKVSAASAESLWQELGFGYKLALIDLQNQLLRLGTDKSSAHCIQRAMHAIAEHAMVYYQTYFELPHHIWSDLHQLYFCAVQLGLQHQKIAMNIGAFDVDDYVTTIEGTYKHALLMSLADPLHLAPLDMRRIADYLSYRVNEAQITALTPLETTSGAFIISLKSNEPPLPYSKQKELPDPDTDILLHTVELARAILRDLNNLNEKILPKDGSIPTDAKRNDYIDLLTYLIKYWGIVPKRVFNRSQKNGELEIVTGLASVHHVLENKPMASHYMTRQDSDNDSTEVRPSRWQIINISATGMSIRRHPTAERNIRVGNLIAIQPKQEKHWSIGAIRWASCGTHDRLDMGVQLLAPQAQSVYVHLSGSPTQDMALLLPEIAAVKQPATLIVPAGTYEPALQLILTYQGLRQHILLTKLIERSAHFERIQFSLINA